MESEEEILPKKVVLGYMTHTEREYIPRPVRCFSCQRSGHAALTCEGREGVLDVVRIMRMNSVGKGWNQTVVTVEETIVWHMEDVKS